jgi:hypothetical protein
VEDWNNGMMWLKQRWQSNTLFQDSIIPTFQIVLQPVNPVKLGQDQVLND